MFIKKYMQFEYLPCNICNSTKNTPLGKRKSAGVGLETNIVQCSSCGLIYPNPTPLLMDIEIQDYFNKPDEYFSTSTSRRFKLFEDALRQIECVKPEKGRILDVGCGRGEFLHVAAERGWEAVGTDISKSFVGYARQNFNANAFVGDLEKIDLPPEYFDAVSLISVIQYIQNPMKTLKKINSLLNKKGVLYIETTNEDALLFRAGDLFQSLKEGEKTTTHLSPLFPSFQMYGFNKQAISRALEKTGFQICDMRIKGICGGGRVKGDGYGNVFINLMRKGIIAIGGLMGRGHLLYCMAKKKEAA
ncbi:MAG: hypothetical protein A2987_06125 [Omnitrophica bacterium RIFCSPLOWO2_01_FULL_45_10]|nr:MAG: hypothetical protein A2987_06125 [Omnitrophica bacterium RIFCSPLOWO2_01_FULL_45_10]